MGHPPSRRPVSSKIAQTTLGDRAVATAPEPSAEFITDRSKYSTFLVTPSGPGDKPSVIYTGDRLWVSVTLVLETAGPVVVGDSATLAPVLSGKGILLPTGVPLTFQIAKGTRLYVQSTALNRIKVLVQPVPWLEQVVGLLRKGLRL